MVAPLAPKDAGAGAPGTILPSLSVEEALSLLQSVSVPLELEHLRFPLPTEILEVAAEIADGSDVLGLERSRLERLVRVVLAMDRAHAGR
jgi:hypothetical protein